MTPEEKVYFYRLVNAGFALNESADRIFAELRNLRSLQANALSQSIWQRLAVAGLTMVAGIPALYQLLPKTASSKVWIYAAVAMGAAYIIFSLVQFIHSRDQGRITIPLGVGEPEGNPAFLRTQLSQYRTRWQMAHEIISDNPPPEIGDRFRAARSYWAKRMSEFPSKIQQLVDEKKLTVAERQELLSWIPPEILQP